MRFQGAKLFAYPVMPSLSRHLCRTFGQCRKTTRPLDKLGVTNPEARLHARHCEPVEESLWTATR
jgi:hypothetical protein